MNAVQIFLLVLLVTTANVAPVIACLLLGDRWNASLDRGLRLADGQPVLGPAKTIRGVMASVTATALMGFWTGYSLAIGAGFACLAMIGDSCSSFIKRRFGLASSRSMPLLDQLPESLLPLWLMQSVLGATTLEILLAAAIFTAIDLLFSGVRKIDFTRQG